ncbi:hypothetical protein ACS0TY_027828 [Phlomoides rotata]
MWHHHTFGDLLSPLYGDEKNANNFSSIAVRLLGFGIGSTNGSVFKRLQHSVRLIIVINTLSFFWEMIKEPWEPHSGSGSSGTFGFQEMILSSTTAISTLNG